MIFIQSVSGVLSSPLCLSASRVISTLRTRYEDLDVDTARRVIDDWVSTAGLVVALGEFEEHDFFALVVDTIQYAIGTHPQPILGHKMPHNQLTC